VLLTALMSVLVLVLQSFLPSPPPLLSHPSIFLLLRSTRDSADVLRKENHYDSRTIRGRGGNYPNTHKAITAPFDGSKGTTLRSFVDSLHFFISRFLVFVVILLQARHGEQRRRNGVLVADRSLCRLRLPVRSPLFLPSLPLFLICS